MERFTKTYLDLMWNGSLDSPKIGSSVDSDKRDGAKSIYEWSRLAEFDMIVWKIAEKIYESNDNILTVANLTAWNPENVVNGGFEYGDDDNTLPAY